MKHTALHRLAVLTSGLTFLLLLVGGIVHGTGSSLACPDWPLCFGEVFPKMEGGVFYEHSHRLFASLIGVLTIAIAVLAVRARKQDAQLGWLGPLALGMVIVQGVLGGLTVIYKLPTLVSTAHLGLSMIFFSLIVYLAWRTRAGAGAAEPTATSIPASLQRFVAIATGAVYLQVVLGGLVRHTGAGMACLNDFILCRGQVWGGLPPIAQVQVVHRIVAIVVALLVVVAAVRVFRAAGSNRFLRTLAVVAPVLLTMQITLGILSVYSLLGLWQVTAHLGGGALLLCNLWLMWLACRPAAEPRTSAAKASRSAGQLVEARS